MAGLNGLGRCGAFVALAGVSLATTGAAGAPPAASAPAAAAVPGAPTVFECSRVQELPRTEVERTFRTEWLVDDFMGEPAAQQPIADAEGKSATRFVHTRTFAMHFDE